MCKNKLHVNEHTQEENTDQHGHINYPVLPYSKQVNIDSIVYITLAERGNLLKYDIIIVHSNFIFILEM